MDIRGLIKKYLDWGYKKAYIYSALDLFWRSSPSEATQHSLSGIISLDGNMPRTPLLEQCEAILMHSLVFLRHLENLFIWVWFLKRGSSRKAEVWRIWWLSHLGIFMLVQKLLLNAWSLMEPIWYSETARLYTLSFQALPSATEVSETIIT